MSKQQAVKLGYIFFGISAVFALIRLIRTGVFSLPPLEWTAPAALFFYLLGCLCFFIAIFKIKQ